MMDAEYLTEAGRIVRMVAAGYAYRSSNVDQRDAEQQAWEIVLEVYKAGGWNGGVSGFGTICYVACNRQLSRYLPWSQQVVSLVDKGERPVMNDAERMPLRCGSLPADRALAIADIRSKLRQRIYQLVGKSEGAQAATLCWMDGYSPCEAAEARKVPIMTLYYYNDMVARSCRSDQMVRRLARQLAQERGWKCDAKEAHQD